MHSSLPSAVEAAFSVTVDGAASEIASGGAISAKRLLLAMSSTIYQGQTVVVSYDKTVAGSDALADSDGNEVASFTTGEDGVPAVVNDSGVMAPPNSAPVFATDLAAYTLPENSAADTVVGTVTATDADDDMLTYSLEGTDAAAFAIDSGTGEIKTRSGVTYNYETQFTYEMTAKASDGNGGSDTIDVRIVLLDDQTEKSAKPAKPSLVPTPGLFTSLAARWTKPGLNGGPDIIGYEVQYRQGAGGSWMNFTHRGAAPTTTITGLTADTEYQVRVRAWNGEALSDWSDASDPESTGEAPTPPTVTSVVVASAPQSGDTYHWGETIVFTVTFNEPVRVTGRPELEVGLDSPAGTSGSTVQARFWGLSESQRPTAGTRPAPVSRHVHFAYTVQPFDRDTDGVRIGADALRLASGDRIRSDATGADAELDHAALGPQTGHGVDGRTTIDGEPAAPVAGAGITFVDGNGDPLETRADGNHRLSVPEGGSARYGMRLKTRPAKNVVLSFHPQAGDADLDVPRNYSSDRSIGPDEWGSRTVWVRVEAAQDADAANGERVFAHNAVSNDPSYHHLVLPDVVAVEADDYEPTCTLNPGDLWCGVVTVERSTDSFGYNGFLTPAAGALSDDDFDVGTNSYTIKLISVGSSTAVTPGSLDITLSARLSAAERGNLVLHIGGAAFKLSEATPSGPSLRWADAGLDWSGKEYVIVRLREATSASRALQGRFVSPPERHDGTKRVKVRVAFSEPIDGTPENVGEHGVDVEGGRVTSVRPVGGNAPGGAGTRKGTRSPDGRNAGQEDREVVWEIEIEPDSDGDVTVSIEAGRPCDEEGAICTADGRSLSEDISTTVEGPEEGPPPLTASFEAMPEAHDGAGAFRFRVAFSEPIGISYRSLREDAFTVTGGRVTRGKRVDDRRDLFEMTVEPDGDGDVTVALPAGRECTVSGAICTKGENRRQLTNAPAATVAGPVVETGPAGLTAAFVGMPSAHRGEGGFRFRVAFSEDIGISFRSLREDAFTVTGGRVTGGKRVDGRRDLFEMTVRPVSDGDVTITLPAGRACAVSGAICTKGENRRKLTNAPSTTVRGPVAVSVADARAREGSDETIDFAVTLSRAATATVAVAYATADGSATAGSDYTAHKGQLSFAPGETATTVRVPVLDDAHDEGAETLSLRLSAASGALIADGVATGTIENSDPLQQAWLARFGRTAATHVTDAVSDRLRGTPGQGSHLTVGGYRLPVGKRGAAGKPEAGARESALLQGVAGLLGLGSGQAGGPGVDPGGGGLGWDAWPDAGRDPRLGQSQSVNLDLRRLLLGSSFRLAFGRDDVGSGWPRLTAWGRVAGTTFDGRDGIDGRDGTLSLNGDVLTGTVGVDGEWDRLLAGLAVAHSRGDGSYTMPGTEDRGRGDLENTLTSVHPYLRYAVNDRLAVWGLFGYGWGELDLEMDNGMTIETDTNLVMGAFGGRGILLSAAESGGFQLATRTDAMLTRTTSDKVAEMESAEADAHRLRLVLEGSRGFTWAEGRRLTPTMEVGLRHDWGDAETGFGLELGGRVQYADPALGLTIDATVRGLLAHEDSDYQEWGASGTVRVAPGAMGQGLSLTLAPAWGATASGVDGLWSRQTTAGLAPNTRRALAGRLNAEVGYGFAPFDTGLLTPYAGTVLSDGAARTYRVGGRLQLTGGWATGLALNLEGMRQEPAGQQPANQGLRLQITWGF